MNLGKGLRATLGLVGLAAWMLYILGCTGWSSWSPDGSRILFPYFDPEAEESRVALYDRETGGTQSLFVQSPADDWSDVSLYTQWDSDGRRVLIVKIVEDGVDMIVLPVVSDQTARHFKLPEIEDRGHSPFGPFPEVEGNLYLGTEYLARLNLETGEQTVQELDSPIATLAVHNGRLFYLREAPQEPEEQPEQPDQQEAEPQQEQQAEEAEEEPEQEEERVEFGEVDPQELTLTPLFQINLTALEQQGVEGLLAFLAFDPSGTRIAMVAEGDPKAFVILCSLSGVEKIFSPEFPVEEFILGNPQWAPDGKIIYMPFLAHSAEEDVLQYSLGEILLEGGTPRLTPITLIRSDSLQDEGWPVFLQASLSPDGATIATTTAYLPQEAIDREARALYLVDVHDPTRPVIRIPAPLKPLPAAAPAEKEE
jgi:hypothetical protein